MVRGEFTQDEGRMLLHEGRWGRFYILRPVQDGGSRIEEVSTKDALTMLR